MHVYSELPRRGDQDWLYTKDGLPSQVTTYNSITDTVINSYTYNNRRLMTGEAQNQSSGQVWSFGYGYNANGHLASLVYPAGLTVNYVPNALGQPTQAGTFATGVSYFPNGAIKQFTYGNWVIHTMTQNARQLPARSTSNGGVLDLGYTYDKNANVTAITDYTTGARQTRGMSYDMVNRLTQTTSNMFGTASYTYDALDNLTTVKVTGGPQVRDHTYVYTNNRLTNVTNTVGGASVIGIGYDVRGNVNNRNGQLYDFDFGNRLRSSQGGLETYRYDAHGRRILSAYGGSIFSMYSKDGQLLWQRDERNSQRLQNIYLGGSLIATRMRPIGSETETITYHHTDALGSPIATTNPSKAVVQASEYEPYGKLLNRSNDNRLGYTGHVMDAATGMTYMQQRYFDPQIGRFLSIDPVTAYSNGDMRHFNRYAYTYNNPYKFVDPDGRDGELYWTAPDQVTYAVRYVLTGVASPVTPAQINAQVAQDFSGTANVNGTNVTVTGQAVQVQQAGPGVNTINVVQNTAGVTKSGRSETNKIGGNQITIGASGPDAATAATVSHELGGHAGGAGDQYKGGLGANNITLGADVPGPANVMKDLSGQPANSQTLTEVIKAPTNVNTCAKGVSAASGGC